MNWRCVCVEYENVRKVVYGFGALLFMVSSSRGIVGPVFLLYFCSFLELSLPFSRF